MEFSHVGIFATDLPKMERFYTAFLGMTVTDRGALGGRQLVFLSRNPAEHHQVVLVSGRPAEVPSTVNQISFRVAGMSALREFFARLAGAALEAAPVTHGNAVSLYFDDPEGNRIEVFFDTPWYCEQPLRVCIDLGKTDDQILGEIEALCRRQPGFKTRDEWMRGLAARMAQARAA